MVELARRGVSGEVARRAVALTYEHRDAMVIAREFAQKHAARLRKLEPEIARRRLAGMLQRRGFEVGDIGMVIDEVLGPVEIPIEFLQLRNACAGSDLAQAGIERRGWRC